MEDSGSTHPNLDPERVAEARRRVTEKLEDAEDLRAEADLKEVEARGIQRTWGVNLLDGDDPRFKVIGPEEAEKHGEYVSDRDNDECTSFLLDTKTATVVFSDAMEPEDATLDRALRPLVDLLNSTTG